MSKVQDLVNQLEDLAELLNKAQTNFKKCPKVRKTKGYLQARVQCMDEYWAKFREIHIELSKLTTKEDRSTLLYFTSDVHSECEELYMGLKADMMDSIQEIQPRQPSLSYVPSTKSSTQSNPEVKLPRINLPSFGGAYEEWQSFEDTFISLIHSNNTLNDVQKLHYLKSCVIGEAKNTIKHFQITEKNYLPAWDNLKNRYSQRRLIVNAILRKLFMLKKLTSPSPVYLKSLIDSTKECINSLNSLDISTTSWDPIIIFLLIQKLDSESHRAWETHVSEEYYNEMPTFENLTTFLDSRICTLELTTSSSSPMARDKVKTFHATTPATQHTCTLCNENHLLCHCKQFGKLDPDKRSEYVRDNRLCYNCLAPGHSMMYCRQKTSCRVCGRRHHSLLHSFTKKDTEEKRQEPTMSSMHAKVEEVQEEDQDITDIATHFASYFTTNRKSSLLATAVVPVRSSSGHTTLLRALIDLGSEASFVSERAAQRLEVIKTPTHARITGIGSTETQVSHSTQLEVLSRYEDSFSLNVDVFIVSTQLTKQLPSKTIAPIPWSHLDGLVLADPKYNVQGKIDMLLGVQVYADIVKGKVVKGPSGSPCAQETSLGWILFGKVRDESHDDRIIVHHHLENIDVHNMLKNMWHIEDTCTRSMTAEERLCEEIYTATHSRTTDGRYVVNLPLKSAQPIEEIGETRDIALKRFYQLERRLESKPKLKEEYKKVIEEYIQLNHMEEVPREEISKPAVYLPHHAVVREDKETTKVRVVFDGSCKGSNGKSLNDELLVGQQLQSDLRDLIMRWRMKPVCFTTDIKMMYRQVIVDKKYTDLQRILWRANINAEVKEYRILRVTFGTAAAPHLSVRTLMQVADDEGKDYSEAAKVIKEDFFVDDCMSGSSNAKEAIQLSKEITTVLERGGFILQKWASNSPEFIAEIEPTLRSMHATQDIKNECMIKTLGLSWNMKSDTLHYRINIPPQPKVITKRNILADIQRFFDPLGWISPAIVLAKMLIQKLWLEKLEWDDAVNETIANEWIKLRIGFEKLNEIEIDRWIKTNNEDLHKTTLHGFSDASEKAYCAVVYARVETKNGDIKVTIIASKTRVAPVKSITLPRLELCGALLLSKLLTQTCEAMRISKDKVYAWTDSSVVLSWLFGDPHRWKLFVSNRVIEIQDNVANTQWFHVTSKDNPADIGSRGRELPLLIESNLWWEGPEWLKTKEIKLSRPNTTATDMERKKTLHVNLKVEHEEETLKFENFETLQELQKVIAYSIRFINSKKHPETIDEKFSTEEYEEALMRCIKIAQFREFGPEIERLQQKKNLRKNSKALNLNPYLDEKNIIRVGGRLRNSDLQTEQKHPIILGTHTHLTNLIIADAHKKTLHGGIQLMLCYLRSKYWIIHAKNAVKACIHKCLICARQRAATRTQIMGDLPKVRVTQARPFLHSGVDFAGPLQILMSKGRGAKSNKAYIAIFICMATKAIHLELVGDLTSESFIGAFNRFIARRGKCTHIWSDQGRNFIGANRELAEAFKEACLELPGNMADILSLDGTQWHNIPAYSPNFGGLWESGVKSTKYHLKRILTKNLTFEEMTTTLCQIESCLNSRPLVPIDASDPDVIDPLTPGHFLIGEAPVVIPSPDLRNVSVTKLSRWQYTQKLVRDFWHRWQSEFITRLQERPKWMKRQKELEPGDIVIVKEDGLPPGKWSLGRITHKHVGPDGNTRVYSLKCRGEIIKRTNTRLCELPIDKSD